jgi:hypothetical protein
MALVVTQISLATVLQGVESGRSAADASVNDLPPAPAKVGAKSRAGQSDRVSLRWRATTGSKGTGGLVFPAVTAV